MAVGRHDRRTAGWLPPLALVMSALTFSASIAAATVPPSSSDVLLDARCGGAVTAVPTCANGTHAALASCVTGELSKPVGCRRGFRCDVSTGACTADSIATHLLRSADYQIVESVGAAEALTCGDPTRDALQGRMLCEVLEATEIVQPTFAHSLGNTWLSAPASGKGTFGGWCNFSTPSEWRGCVGANIAKQGALIVARAPHVLLSAGLMEFLDQHNLDDPSKFASECCQPGTVGIWGGNNTCVPNIKSQCVQEYYTEWGKVFLDAGIRAFFFGQSRLTGGGRPCNADGYTGCSRVSADGAAGFAAVLANLKAYAASKGYGRVWFGPQAASGFELANGTEIADWTYGAQHLHSRDRWLVQPFGVNGTYPRLGPQWYGTADLHDANRANNANGLPVMLDFDNFSGDEDMPDDIRRLSSWPNTTRAQFFKTLWHTARMYNPRVSVSVPLSKAAGGNWPAFRQPQGQCWSGAWGDRRGDGLFFGAVSCGLVNVSAEVFAGPELPTPAQVLAAVDTWHFGAALQSPDLTAVWAFQTLLGRDFTSVAEYHNAVLSLPELVLGARGAREGMAARVVASPKFAASKCATDPACVALRLGQFLCLGNAACEAVHARIASSSSLGRVAETPLSSGRRASSAQPVNETIHALALAADSVALFGNAALMDPAWKLGDGAARGALSAFGGSH